MTWLHGAPKGNLGLRYHCLEGRVWLTKKYKMHRTWKKKNVCSTQKIKINRGIRREWLSIQWHKGEKLFLPPKSDKKRPQRTLQACRGSTVSGCPFLSVYVIASVINTLVMSLHKIITCEYYWFCNLCYIRGCLGCTYWGRLLPAPYT